jgi:hypothetical protein
MNHEPIQFLPIAPFWKQAQNANRKAAHAFLLGLVIGTAGTVLAAWLIISGLKLAIGN